MSEHRNVNPTCPECGAREVEGMNCWWQLGAIGQWEFQDPELLAVHFLTVASYNLQHPASFTDEALTGLSQLFCQAVDHGWSNEHIRRQVAETAEGKSRVLRKEGKRVPVLRQWPMTIADVYIPGHPQGAADRVRAWAAVIREALR